MIRSGETPTRIGNYEIVERIACGGMAEVLRARVAGTHGFVKEFALKRMLPHLCGDERFIAMLVDEARILVTLNPDLLMPPGSWMNDHGAPAGSATS